MTGDAPVERFPAQGALMLVAGIVLSALLAYVLRLISFPPEPAAVIASSAAPLPAAIANGIYKRRRGIRAELASLGRGALERPAPLVVSIVAGLLLLIAQTTAWVVGAIVGIGLGVGSVPMELWPAAVGTAMVLFVYPIVGIAAFFVGRRACHYFRRRVYAWLLLAVAVFAGLQVVLDSVLLLMAPTAELLVTVLVVASIVYAAMSLGAWSGLHHHEQFVASKLLRKLSRDDLHAVTAIIRDAVDERLREPTSGGSAGVAR